MGIRSFDMHLVDGIQTVTIMDVIVHNGDVHLVLKGKREKLHVVRIRPTGFELVPGVQAEVIEGLHTQEVLRWTEISSSEAASS